MKRFAGISLFLSTLFATSLLLTFNTYRTLITGYLSSQYVNLYDGYLKLVTPMNLIVISVLVISIALMSVLTIYMCVLLYRNRYGTYIAHVILHGLMSIVDLFLVVFVSTNFSNVFTGTIDITTLIFVIMLAFIIHIITTMIDALILMDKVEIISLQPLKINTYHYILAVSAFICVGMMFFVSYATQLMYYCFFIYLLVINLLMILVTSVIQIVNYHSLKQRLLPMIGVGIVVGVYKLISLPLFYSMIVYFIYGMIEVVVGLINKHNKGQYKMKISEIVQATNGKLLCGDLNATVNHFTQDSRQCVKNSMYIPIIGENNDGHNYIQSAFDNGASTIITDREIIDDKHNIILVKDTTIALGDMARFVRENHDVKVVGITGSVGKTSTKDMIYSVVSQKYKSLKTLGNYNNQIGLPLTILRYQNEEVMVIEMGMNHLREIAYLSDIARPDIAAITNVGTAHIGEVGGRDNILKAKMEITEGLAKNGVLVLNDDNDKLHEVKDDRFNIIRVGNNVDTFKPQNVQLDLLSSDFDIEYEGSMYHVHVPTPGAHFITNALVAMAVGISLDIDIKDCIKGIETFELTKNRMDLIKLDHNVTLIDGTYNANVDSMKSSIDVLASSKNRKIAVLADMLELGEYEQSLHEEVGTYISNKVDLLLCVGDASKHIINASKDVKVKEHFENNEALIAYLKENVQENDVILVKGSNGMHLKEVVEAMKGE